MKISEKDLEYLAEVAREYIRFVKKYKLHGRDGSMWANQQGMFKMVYASYWSIKDGYCAVDFGVDMKSSVKMQFFAGIQSRPIFEGTIEALKGAGDLAEACERVLVELEEEQIDKRDACGCPECGSSEYRLVPGPAFAEETKRQRIVVECQDCGFYQ